LYQLWGLGRVADPTVAPKHGDYDFCSSGDIPEAEGKPKPRPFTKEEIKEVVQLYAKAAKDAVEVAGFDGVEVQLFAFFGMMIDCLY
jgi:NADPH2 dehydrogenase